MNDPKRDLLDIYQAALQAVEGRRVVAEALRADAPDGEIHLIAIGKAAASMALGAFDVLGRRIRRALVVSKRDHGDPELEQWPVEYREAGHPLPDLRSLEAGAALAVFLDEVPPKGELLFLLSGGSSALVETLPEGVELEALERANQWLLAAGLAIGEINTVRRALSTIKGGRLAARLGGRPTLGLLISDVPGDDPAVIGSGLLAPSPPRPLPALPEWLAAWIERAPPPPAAGAPCFDAIELRVVATLEQAKAAAARRAATLGYPVRLHQGPIHGDATEAGHGLALFLANASSGVHVWGGETTVRLPPEPGRGGRCQQLALAAALGFQHRDDITFLAAGSDGGDGPGEVAGALVDGATVAQGELHTRAAEYHLERCDAGSFLEAADALIDTGPTGTNVMDLMIGLKR
ncbi:glycerate kinase type-2 family protein [Endothiovibrio diazotrophicus]